MKILSLFDGMSVAQQAISELYTDYVYYASEIDEYAMSVTQSNFPKTIQIGSVTDFFSYTNWKEVYVDFDLLIGGSPCQDLSIAKKNRKGLDGDRSGLFWEYVRILKEVKPKYFILENVASMPKEAKEVISEALGVQPIMINASLVSAQNRKRLFWTNIPNVTLPEDKGIVLKDILEQNVDKKYIVNISEKYGEKGLKDISGKSGSLTASMWKGYGNDGVTTIRIPEATKKGYAIATEGQSVDLSFPNSKTRRGRVGDKVKNLMTSQNIGVFTQGEIRKLTPIECLRLQSMPDEYFDKAIYNNKPISNSQKYKMCGNAFNKDVILHILNKI